jgi:hypothetical protein
MTTFSSFTTAAAGWQNFYILVGTAAATLTGLMFVAITFGSSLVTKESSPSARAFLDPTFTHFVHILVTACVFTIPSMTAPVLGVVLIVMAGLRGTALVRVYRHMKAAQAKAGDLDLSDWMSGIVLPAACYLVLVATGAGFLDGDAVAFDTLATVMIAVLLVGVFGAWELMVWMAVARAERSK